MTTDVDVPDDLHDDPTEEAWLAEPPKRSRLRPLLVAVLTSALVFLAGVEVQKKWGASPSDTAAASTGFPGGGALPEGFTPPSQGQGETTLPGAGQGQTKTSADADTTAVIGTLVSIEDGVWTVEDLGGNTHTITVGGDVRIVRETTVAPDAVEDGATIDIEGTDDQGQVTATTITVR